MLRRRIVIYLSFGVGLLAGASNDATAQLVILDDLLALTQAREGGGGEVRDSTASFGHLPGSGAERIQELVPPHAELRDLGLRGRLNPNRFAPVGPRRLRVGGAEEEEEPREGTIARLARLRQEPGARFQPASFGVLDLPAFDDEGPPEGLTLDMALHRLFEANLELQTDVMELSMADADIFAASRFNNPLLFYAADGMPWSQVSPEREQEVAHDFTVVYPFDVTFTRRNRTELARRARSVIEAQFNDAIRGEISQLYRIYVNVLAARETIRYAAAGIVTLDRLIEEVDQQRMLGLKPDSDVEELTSLRELTLLAMRQGQRNYIRAKRHLAEVLNIHPAEADYIPVRGSLTVAEPPLPPLPALIDTAMQYRPDLQAFRFGVGHAEAHVALNRSHVFKELFVFFTPITYEDRSLHNQLSTRGWGAGVMFEMPFFDFNRGQIRHAQHNVIRTQREVALLERRIITEVQDAHQDYIDSFDDLRLLELDLLPRAQRNREVAFQRYLEGRADLDEMELDLAAFEEIVRIYKDAKIQHRRSMLGINTAVGMRIMP